VANTLCRYDLDPAGNVINWLHGSVSEKNTFLDQECWKEP